MDITPLIPAGRQLIQGYGDGGFNVSGTRYQGSVLIFPGRTIAWPVASMADISADSFAALRDAEAPLDIMILGCGKQMLPLRSALRQELRALGVVIETMDTGAACRTYNVLLAEERRVAAALIAV